MEWILLVIGFLLLIKGADFFVDGASSMAEKLNVSPMVVGLTIVAFGTSAPEAVVSIIAALDGNGDMVLGNIIGSNIVNITLLLGITAMVSTLVIERQTRTRELPYSLIAAGLLLILMSDAILFSSPTNVVGRVDGIILLAGIVLFIFYILIKTKRSKHLKEARSEEDSQNMSWPKSIVLFVIGLLGIIFGGEMVVSNASSIAISLGMSQALVGLTIVAIGTSLPELVTSITAALKGEASIAIGNIVGSNIFNIFFVAGLSATIEPLNVSGNFLVDGWILIGATVLLLVLALWRKKLTKIEGVILIVFYAVYLVYIILRG